MASKKEFLRKYTVLTVGCAFYAAGVSLFLDPCSLAPGGVSGIAIILNKFIEEISTGTWVAILNVPIFAIGIVALGFKFLIPTLYAVAISSVMMNLMTYFIGGLTDSVLLASVFGAVLVAFGIGLVFRVGATTGGTDIIVKALKKKFRHMNTGFVFILVDGAVVLASAIVFRDIELALYAAASVFVSSIVMNKVLYGTDGARLVYVISDKYESIEKRLMNELDSGVTNISVRGSYTGAKREMLMCVLRAKALPEARDIVKQEDKDAFMIVTSATSVFGEGYRSHEEEEL